MAFSPWYTAQNIPSHIEKLLPARTRYTQTPSPTEVSNACFTHSLVVEGLLEEEVGC